MVVHFFEDRNAKNMYELVSGANYELKPSANCAHLLISSLSLSLLHLMPAPNAKS